MQQQGFRRTQHHTGVRIQPFQAIGIHAAHAQIPGAGRQAVEVDRIAREFLAEVDGLELCITGGNHAIAACIRHRREGPDGVRLHQRVCRAGKPDGRQQLHRSHFRLIWIHGGALTLLQQDGRALPGVLVVDHALQHFGTILTGRGVGRSDAEAGAAYTDQRGSGFHFQRLGTRGDLVDGRFQRTLGQAHLGGKPVHHASAIAAVRRNVVAAQRNVRNGARHEFHLRTIGQHEHGRAVFACTDPRIFLQAHTGVDGLSVHLHITHGVRQMHLGAAETQLGQRRRQRGALCRKGRGRGSGHGRQSGQRQPGHAQHGQPTDSGAAGRHGNTELHDGLFLFHYVNPEDCRKNDARKPPLSHWRDSGGAGRNAQMIPGLIPQRPRRCLREMRCRRHWL